MLNYKADYHLILELQTQLLDEDLSYNLWIRLGPKIWPF